MAKIRYDEETRTFGVLADRVRESGLSYLKAKASTDKAYEDKRNEYEARKAMIDDYGATSPTGKNTAELEESQMRHNESEAKRNRKLWLQTVNINEPFDKAIETKLKGLKESMREKEQHRRNKSYSNKRLNKKVIDYYKNRGAKFALIKYGPVYEDAVRRKGEYHAFHRSPIASGHHQMYFGRKIQNNPFISAHELRHLQQEDKGTKSLENFVLGKREHGGKKTTAPNDFHSAKHILTYLTGRNKDEHDANYKALMVPYLMGASKTAMSVGHKTSSHSNRSYDKPLLGYTPQNLDWHMDAQAKRRMQEQMRQGND